MPTEDHPHRTDFQKVLQILEQVRSRISPEANIIWTRYDTDSKFLSDLERDMKQIALCDLAAFHRLHLQFAPTGTYQEISLDNGWGADFLLLAEEFDGVYKRLMSRISQS